MSCIVIYVAAGWVTPIAADCWLETQQNSSNTTFSAYVQVLLAAEQQAAAGSRYSGNVSNRQLICDRDAADRLTTVGYTAVIPCNVCHNSTQFDML